MFNLHHKLPHDPSAILRRISPQHRAEYLDSLFAFSVICPGADVADVRAELVDDLLNVLQLLRGDRHSRAASKILRRFYALFASDLRLCLPDRAF